MRTFTRSAVLIVAALLAAPPVFAQPRPPAPAGDVRSQLPEGARRAWDAAKQLADAKDYKGALVELQHAYELSEPARPLQRGRTREAAHALRARGRRVGARATRGRRQAVAQRDARGAERDRHRAAVRHD